MTVLERIYASAGSADGFVIHTLEIANSAWAAPYRFAQSFEDIIARLETGETVTFQASGIGLQLPKRGVAGREDLTFQLDNVSGEAAQAIRLAQEAGTITTATYRPYSSLHLLEGPAETPISLIATVAKLSIRSVQVTATYRDFVNKAWPKYIYNLARFPGLLYFHG